MAPNQPAQGGAEHGPEPEGVGGSAVVDPLAEGLGGEPREDVEIRQQSADCAPYQGPASQFVGKTGLTDHGAEQSLGCTVHARASERAGSRRRAAGPDPMDRPPLRATSSPWRNSE